MTGSGEVVGRVPVTGGLKDQVEALCPKEVNLHLSDQDLKELTRKIIAAGPLEAPVKEGQEIGTVVFMLKGRELTRSVLVAAGRVEKPGLLHRISSML